MSSRSESDLRRCDVSLCSQNWLRTMLGETGEDSRKPLTAGGGSVSLSETTQPVQPRRVAGLELCVVLVLLVLAGSVNFVLLKVVYSAYGEERAFFVSQGINLLYVCYGAVLVYPRLLGNGRGQKVSKMLGLDDISQPEMRRMPQAKFLAMGVLDCFGTFFTAMGAVNTPGQYQPLLNQSLVPVTMVVSFIFLRARYTLKQTMGATLIISGAVISLAPRIVAQDDGGSGEATGSTLRVYAVIICTAHETLTFHAPYIPSPCPPTHPPTTTTHPGRSEHGRS